MSDQWRIVKTIPNPWGIVPVTGGGRSLTARAKEYMDRVEATAAKRDCKSRRHHYVPQSYLRAWSADGVHVWVLDTTTGAVRCQSVTDTCVSKDFYRVTDDTGLRHNQVEQVMSVFDDELNNVLLLFRNLQPGDDFTFDDFMSLGQMVVLSRLRTPQRRRILSANQDFVARHEMTRAQHEMIPLLKVKADFHIDLIFKAMFEAADFMTTRYIQIWDDPRGRFITSDAPVQPNRDSYVTVDLTRVPHIWWPISPTRAICLNRDSDIGVKAEFHQATNAVVNEVNTAMIRGRERAIIATKQQLALLPVGKPLAKRTQMHVRCEPIASNQCGVALMECYATKPDIKVCHMHFELPHPELHA